MKFLWIIFTMTATLFGFADTVKTFSADFNQTITDDTNQTIVYRGHVDAARPKNARWDYTEPVIKQVFVNDHTVTIIEPELEQIIIKTIDEDVDLFNILKRAKPIVDNTFLAEYKEQKFYLTMDGDVLVEISYRDTFENRVRLQFYHQNINHIIDQILFEPKAPSYYDVLTE